MKFVKHLFQFYIEASIHVALSVACLIALTFYKFQIPFDLTLCLVGFLATVFSYNFMKYETAARTYFKVSGVYFKFIVYLSMASLLWLLFLVFQLHFRVWVVLGITGVLTALYALPLLPNQQSFRSLSGLKVYFVALCWALTTVIVPVVDDEKNIDVFVWMEFLQRFFLVLALLIPFDIRDLKDDNLSLGTLPQQLGIQKAKWIGYGFAALFLFFGWAFQPFALADFWIAFLLAGGIYFAKIEQSKFYASFWVESVPIIWWLLYML